jgi:hypothetical protein
MLLLVLFYLYFIYLFLLGGLKQALKTTVNSRHFKKKILFISQELVQGYSENIYGSDTI